MIKYLASESYKLICSKFIYFSLFWAFLYSLLVNILYLLDGEILLLYNNFINEYLLLYLVLGLYYACVLITDEYAYGTINDLSSVNAIVGKIIVLLLYLFGLFLCSFLFSYDLSFLLSGDVLRNIRILGDIFISFGKCLPMLISLNLLCMLIGTITKKGNLTLIGIYLIFFASEYLKTLVISRNWSYWYYIPCLIWNFNNWFYIKEYLPLWMAILIFAGFIIKLLVSLIYFFNHRR